MKKKKKVKKVYDYRKTILVFTIVFSIIIAISTYWVYAYKHKRPYLEDTLINYKINDYVETKGNIVYLKNIDDNISNSFISSQVSILNNDIIDIDITKTIYKNILSIKITYILSSTTNYEEILILNYNLKENKEMDTISMLEMTNIAYRTIAESIFDNYVKLDNDNVKVIDAINNEELTGSEFNNNSYKYITRVRENLPDIINIYIKDNKLYYIVKVEDINKLCYTQKIKTTSNYINEEIDKL